MFIRLSSTVLMTTVIFVITSSNLYSTSPKKGAIAASIEHRQNELLTYLASQQPENNNIWSLESYAIASYSQSENLDKADEAVIKITNMLSDKSFRNKHWHIYLVARLYWLYASKETPRMGKSAISSVIECLHNFLQHSEINVASIGKREQVWTYISSENHHIQTFVSVWSAASILSDIKEFQADKYDDFTNTEIKKNIEHYFKNYIKEKSTKGLLTEVASPTYTKYSLNALINLHDFTSDQELKKLMDMFLTIYFADWGLEQFNGIRGGSKHRSYSGEPSVEFQSSIGWIPFGLGKKAVHPAYLSFATTSWRPQEFLIELINEKKGTYEIYSRRPGLKSINHENKRAQDPKGGGLLKYSYVTPSFIAGMSMVNATEASSWTNYSSQNRRNFIVFKGENPAKIFTQRSNPVKNKSVYNAEWGVQDKGVMILQLLPKPYSRNAAGQMIFISKTLPIKFESPWYFIEGKSAYSALRIMSGKGTIHTPMPSDYRNGDGDLTAGKYLKLSNQLSPIIVETRDNQYYSNFEEFKKEILSNNLQYIEEKLTYTSQAYKTKLTLYSDYSRLPEINGSSVDLSPDYAFYSKYMCAQYASGVVTLLVDERLVVLNFNNVSVDASQRQSLTHTSCPLPLN